MDRLLSFCDAYVYGDEIFFSSMKMNGLFKMSKNTMDVKFLGVFEKERCFDPILHSKVIEDNRKLYFIPAYGCGISIYDLETAKFDYISIKEKNSTPLYIDAVKYGERWLLVPNFLEVEFAIFDPHTNKIELCPQINVTLIKACKGWRQGIDFSSVKIQGEKLYITFFDTGYIVEYDLQNDDVRCICINGKHFSKLELDGDVVWATTLYGEIDRIDIKTGDYKEYNIVKSNKREFSTCIKWKDRLFLTPSLNNSIWEYDYNMDSWRNFTELSSNEIIRKEGYSQSMFMGFFALNDELLIFPIAATAGMSIDSSGISRVKYEYDVECEEILKNNYREMIDIQNRNSEMLFESSSFGLEQLLWSM